MGKKGATNLITGSIIAVIILVLSLVVILGFYLRANPEGIIDDQVCYQSVLLRSNTPSFGNLKDKVPLKCNTEKICLGDECEVFENTKPLTTIKVDDKEDIEKAISQELLGCWNMMGEGRLGLYSDFYGDNLAIASGKDPICVVCSRFAFDEANLKDKGIMLENVDVYKYMLTHKRSGSDISYYEELVGESPISLGVDLSSASLAESVEQVSGEQKVEPAQVAVVFAQVTSPEHLKVLRNTGSAGVIAGTLAIKIPGSIQLAGSAGLPGIVTVLLGLGAQQVSVANLQSIASGYCGDVETATDAKNGCSVIRVVTYDAEYLNKYCGVIESNS